MSVRSAPERRGLPLILGDPDRGLGDRSQPSQAANLPPVVSVTDRPIWNKTAHSPEAELSRQGGGPHGSISDCYALNVDRDTAWTCYYTDFPIVRVRDGALTGWHNHITSVNALAVSGSRAALYGGYGPDRDRLAAGLLNGDRFRQTGEHRLVLPGGEPIPTSAHVIGRGPCLHVLTKGDWYQLTMSDVPSGTAPAADRACQRRDAGGPTGKRGCARFRAV